MRVYGSEDHFRAALLNSPVFPGISRKRRPARVKGMETHMQVVQRNGAFVLHGTEASFFHIRKALHRKKVRRRDRLMYRKVPTDLNFVKREEEVEKFWDDNRIF